MGLLGHIFTSKGADKMNEESRANNQSEYVPADRGVTTPPNGGIQSKASAVADRASRFYRENPKMVAGLGLAAALMALSALKRRPPA